MIITIASLSFTLFLIHFFVIPTMKRLTQAQQLEKDIEFCIDICNMNDEQIGEMLRVCETLGGISCEYFAEEFVFLCGKEEEHIPRYHDDNYLRINWSLN